MKRIYGFQPKKRLGQHFLRDKGIVREIIKRARFGESDQVLEIGAGLGALTLPLSESVQEIIAVEKDFRLTEMLRKKLQSADIKNVVLINEDILKLDLGAVPHRPERKLKVIGNLPYNISSPFLEKLVEHRNLVSKAVLMFQFELARRLIAKPGNREFGSLTVLIQYHANLSPLMKVSKESFYPKPKVGSMVLELDFERPHPNQAEDKSKFKVVVKGAFAHRRKTLLNSLRRTLLSCSDAEISAALQRCGIDPRRRAETLDIDDFLCLTSMLPSLS
jgi:16S rRNA (adenine1518-N6/adenine1519-N6)-dimethyltransferase